MELSDLLAFGKVQHARLRQRNGHDHSELAQTYAEVIKISEEVGELCDVILAKSGNQRKEKLTSSSDEKILEEMADIVLTVFVLAANLGLDLPTAIEEKIVVVNERFGHSKQ